MGEFVMPALGADMDEGTLLEWRVHPGDVVHRGDVVAVVDTAKSAIDVEVFEDGVVEDLFVLEGTVVPVGAPLARLGALGAAVSAPAPSVPVAAAEHPGRVSPPVRHLAHELGVDLDRVAGTGDGGAVTRADVSAAAAALVPAAQPAPPMAPAAAGLAVAAGPSAAPPEATARTRPPRSGVRSSPLARRRAAALGVNLAALAGTGPSGAVTASDVEAAAGTVATAAPQAAPLTAPAPAAAPPVAARPVAGDERRRALRTSVGELMARSKREIPHYYLATTVELGATLDWLRTRNAGRPVTERVLPAALVLKACALAVAAVPAVNGHFVDGEFHASASVHLGVAVALRGGGLVAPALRDAERLPLDELMAALKTLVTGARSGRLRSSQAVDPTMTVTNLGEQGVEVVHGVIYPPQVALVGVGRIVERPWAVDGLLGVRPVVTLTLAADHRVTDGHDGAAYLAAVADLLGRPGDL